MCNFTKGSYLEMMPKAPDKDPEWKRAARNAMQLDMDTQKRLWEEAKARQARAVEGGVPPKKNTPLYDLRIVCGACGGKTAWNVWAARKALKKGTAPVCRVCLLMLWDPELFKAADFVLRTTQDVQIFNRMLKEG